MAQVVDVATALKFTPFDYRRRVRPLITDDKRTVSIDIDQLGDEIQCPVCLQVLRETKIAMTCMHRFCSECIEKALRTNNNECPSCRGHIPSRRSLRPDVAFDKFIATLFPDLAEREAKEEQEMALVSQYAERLGEVLDQEREMTAEEEAEDWARREALALRLADGDSAASAAKPRLAKSPVAKSPAVKSQPEKSPRASAAASAAAGSLHPAGAVPPEASQPAPKSHGRVPAGQSAAAAAVGAADAAASSAAAAAGAASAPVLGSSDAPVPLSTLEANSIRHSYAASPTQLMAGSIPGSEVEVLLPPHVVRQLIASEAHHTLLEQQLPESIITHVRIDPLFPDLGLPRAGKESCSRTNILSMVGDLRMFLATQLNANHATQARFNGEIAPSEIVLRQFGTYTKDFNPVPDDVTFRALGMRSYMRLRSPTGPQGDFHGVHLFYHHQRAVPSLARDYLRVLTQLEERDPRHRDVITGSPFMPCPTCLRWVIEEGRFQPQPWWDSETMRWAPPALMEQLVAQRTAALEGSNA